MQAEPDESNLPSLKFPPESNQNGENVFYNTSVLDLKLENQSNNENHYQMVNLPEIDLLSKDLITGEENFNRTNLLEHSKQQFANPGPWNATATNNALSRSPAQTSEDFSS